MKQSFSWSVDASYKDNINNIEEVENPIISREMRDLALNLQGNSIFIKSAEMLTGGIYFELETSKTYIDCLTMYCVESINYLSGNLIVKIFIKL